MFQQLALKDPKDVDGMTVFYFTNNPPTYWIATLLLHLYPYEIPLQFPAIQTRGLRIPKGVPMAQLCLQGLYYPCGPTAQAVASRQLFVAPIG